MTRYLTPEQALAMVIRLRIAADYFNDYVETRREEYITEGIETIGEAARALGYSIKEEGE